jgi:hypothetical protein
MKQLRQTLPVGVLVFLALVFPCALRADDEGYSALNGIIPAGYTIVGATPWNETVVEEIQRFSSDDDSILRDFYAMVLPRPIRFEDVALVKEKIKAQLISEQNHYAAQDFGSESRQLGLDNDWNGANELGFKTIARGINTSFRTILKVFLSLKSEDGKPAYGLYVSGAADRLSKEEIDLLFAGGPGKPRQAEPKAGVVDAGDQRDPYSWQVDPDQVRHTGEFIRAVNEILDENTLRRDEYFRRKAADH